MIDSICAVVLAGGPSRRFGSDKAFAPWGEGTLTDAAVSNLRDAVGCVHVVTRKPEAFGHLAQNGIRIDKDSFKEHHPLGGLVTALQSCETQRVFLTACDMPLVSRLLIHRLVEASHGYMATVPKWKGVPQPLCGVYDRGVIGVARLMIREKKFRFQDLLGQVRTRFLLPPEVRVADPEGLSFLDIDTPKDYAAVYGRYLRAMNGR